MSFQNRPAVDRQGVCANTRVWVRTLNIVSGNRGSLGHCQAEGARGEQKVSSPFILCADGGKVDVKLSLPVHWIYSLWRTSAFKSGFKITISVPVCKWGRVCATV